MFVLGLFVLLTLCCFPRVLLTGKASKSCKDKLHLHSGYPANAFIQSDLHMKNKIWASIQSLLNLFKANVHERDAYKATAGQGKPKRHSLKKMSSISSLGLKET